jgi:membrane-associated PAP2 superfamily phosphatase
MIRAGLILCSVLAIVVGVVFALWPQIDLDVARAAYVGGGLFAGDTPGGQLARRAGYLIPYVLLAGAVALWFSNWRWKWPRRAPGGRTLLFLALSLALGPGVMANVIFKDNWRRPRPVQVAEFGGTMEFKPWWRTNGACKRNCSFVAGEGSLAFWTLAPAIVAPASAQPYAIVAAVVFGGAVSALRIAFGGHFLSDTLFAGLFTALIVLALHRIMFSPPARKPPLRT